MDRRFKRGDRVRPIPGTTYHALRGVEGAAQNAVVTNLRHDPRWNLDSIDVQFEDGEEWVIVLAKYFEAVPTEEP